MADLDRNRLKDAIRAALEKESIRSFLRRTKISPSSYFNIMNDIGVPRMDTLEKISTATGHGVPYFYGGLEATEGIDTATNNYRTKVYQLMTDMSDDDQKWVFECALKAKSVGGTCQKIRRKG